MLAQWHSQQERQHRTQRQKREGLGLEELLLRCFFQRVPCDDRNSRDKDRAKIERLNWLDNAKKRKTASVNCNS